MANNFDKTQRELDSGSLQHITVSQDGTTLFLTGQIEKGKTGDLFLKTVQSNPKIKHIVINSPGGNVAEADKIGRWLDGKGQDVAVHVEGICASACTAILQCANEATADENALFMYHAAALDNEGERMVKEKLGGLGEIGVQLANRIGTIASHQTCKSFVKGSRKLLENQSERTTSKDMFCYTAQQMQDQFHIVDDITSIGLVGSERPYSRRPVGRK